MKLKVPRLLAIPLALATRATLPAELIDWVNQRFHRLKGKSSRQRLGDALLTLHRPGPEGTFRRDGVRMTAVERRMNSGDMSRGRRKRSHGVNGPKATIPRRTARRFEPLSGPSC